VLPVFPGSGLTRFRNRWSSGAAEDYGRSRVVKKLDLLESNHGCGLDALSRKTSPNGSNINVTRSKS